MDIKERIIKCLEEEGIEITENGTFEELESIIFISVVIALEEEFGVEFPDEYLLTYKITDIDIICDVIGYLLDNKS